ncbi:unnamed protein product [Cyclocybe aegerita]|uniref:Uncharacterized protein n=1 Tax=Cyclocybe aegerita TaxID=1973307 RepID=A0A8S0XGT3_CYCAE|nr:unnamed protein product [Cyclocybe aegerita]
MRNRNMRLRSGLTAKNQLLIATNMETPLWNFPSCPPHGEREAAELSDAQTYAASAKLAFLTYRIGFISSFVSAAEETLRFLSTISYPLYHLSVQILELVEMARKTLESAKVLPYLWASCPRKLVPHKRVYVELLRALRSKECYIDPEHYARLRVLLLPLSSRCAITRKGTDSPSAGSFQNEILATPYPVSSRAATPPGVMPPPSTVPSQQPNKQPQKPSVKSRAENKRLWTPEELAPPPSKVSHRKELRMQWANRENAAPAEEQEVVFRPVRSRLRFGICFSAKSPMNSGVYKQRHRVTRVSSVRSLMNPKE